MALKSLVLKINAPVPFVITSHYEDEHDVGISTYAYNEPSNYLKSFVVLRKPSGKRDQETLSQTRESISFVIFPNTKNLFTK